MKVKLKDALTKEKQKKIIIDDKVVTEYYLVDDVHKAIKILCHRFNYLWRDGEKEPWRPNEEEDLIGIFDEIKNSFPVIYEDK